MPKYLPEEEQESAADLIYELLSVRDSINKGKRSNNSYEKQFKELVTTLLWKHSEAFGKYKGCPYFSLGAIESLKKHEGREVTNKSIDPIYALRHEHLFPRKQLVELLMDLEEISLESVVDLLELNIAVVVTVEEDSKLSKSGDRDNPWKRYEDAGVEWVKMD